METQLVLAGVRNAIEMAETTHLSDPNTPIRQGLRYIETWLNQDRAERTSGHSCTVHDHITATFHSAHHGWIATHDLTRLVMIHSDQQVLREAKYLLRGGDFSEDDETIVIYCCADNL